MENTPFFSLLRHPPLAINPFFEPLLLRETISLVAFLPERFISKLISYEIAVRLVRRNINNILYDTMK